MTRTTWGALWAILLFQRVLCIWGASLEWCCGAGKITVLLAVYKATSPILDFSAPFYTWGKARFWLYLPPNLILLTSISGRLHPGPDCHIGGKEALFETFWFPLCESCFEVKWGIIQDLVSERFRFQRPQALYSDPSPSPPSCLLLSWGLRQWLPGWLPPSGEGSGLNFALPQS